MIVYIAGIYRGHFKNICDRTYMSLSAGFNNVFFFTQEDDYISFIVDNIDKIKIIHSHSCFSFDLYNILNELNYTGIRILQRNTAHIMIADPLAGVEQDISPQLYEYTFADYILVSSDWEQKTFDLFGNFNIIKLPYSIDSTEWNIEHNRTKEFNVAYTGYDRRMKGFKYLEAAVQKSGVVDNFIVNEGRTENLLKSYKNVSLFALPSLQDGYPVACLEAMSCSIPTLVSWTNGVREIIKHGDNGFIVPPRDVNSIVEIIKYLYNNRDEVERIGNNGRKTIMSYTWEDYQGKVVEVYSRLLNGEKI